MLKYCLIQICNQTIQPFCGDQGAQSRGKKRLLAITLSHNTPLFDNGTLGRCGTDRFGYRGCIEQQQIGRVTILARRQQAEALSPTHSLDVRAAVLSHLSVESWDQLLRAIA